MKTEEFFDKVRTGKLFDSDIYNHVQEITDDFDEKKLNLLCKDFDFYLFMAKEEWLASVSDEVDQKIQEFNEQDKKIPMLSDRDFSPTYVSDHFKTSEHKKVKKEKDWTEEELKKIDKFAKDWEETKKKTIDVEKLIDPHGIEFYSLYKLRNLLVELKRKHTSAEYKFEIPGQSFNPHNKKFNSDKSETFKFIELVDSGELSKLDIHNRVQKLTDNYDEDKLNLLCGEFDSYIFVKYENWRASYSQDQIKNKIESYDEKGIEVPIKGDKKNKHQLPFVDDFFLFERYGKPVSDEEYQEFWNELLGKESNKHDVIDDNVLLGGFYHDTDSNHLRNLRDILIKLKRKHTSAVYKFDDKPEDLQVNENDNNTINWLKSDDTLEQLIEGLKEQNLIEQRDTKAIINDHFKPVRESNNEPKPIEWIYQYKNLLAYLIRELHNNRYISCENIWQEMEPHFAIDGEIVEGLRQLEDQYIHRSNTGKPSSHKIVDNIIQNLPE